MTTAPPTTPVPPLPTEGIYEDVERQLLGLQVKHRTSSWTTKGQTAPYNTWIARGSPEGGTPAVKVEGVSLGMTGKSADKKRGLDIFEYMVGGESKTAVKLAIGVDAVTCPKLRALLRGAMENLVKVADPITKSRWYEKTFSDHLTDGTKVFRATSALQSPEEFLDMSFQEDAVWDSPSSTWAPFLYGPEEDDTKWYIKTKVSEDAQVYLYSNKKGVTEFNKTSEEGQVVYPRGGVPVKNTNMLRTLLSSKLYREKTWRAKCILKLTGITLKCAPSGTNPEGGQMFSMYPVFTFTIPTAVVLVEHDPASDEDGGLTDKQREAATRAVLFEGMVAPKIKRKSRENAPLFNQSGKKRTKVDTPEAVQESDEEEELDTEGEDA